MGHTSCVMDNWWAPVSTFGFSVCSDLKLIQSIWFKVVYDRAGGWTGLVVPVIAGFLLPISHCELSEWRQKKNRILMETPVQEGCKILTLKF